MPVIYYIIIKDVCKDFLIRFFETPRKYINRKPDCRRQKKSRCPKTAAMV